MTPLPGGLIATHQQVGHLLLSIEDPAPVVEADRHVSELDIGLRLAR